MLYYTYISDLMPEQLRLKKEGQYAEKVPLRKRIRKFFTTQLELEEDACLMCHGKGHGKPYQGWVYPPDSQLPYEPSGNRPYKKWVAPLCESCDATGVKKEYWSPQHESSSVRLKYLPHKSHLIGTEDLKKYLLAKPNLSGNLENVDAWSRSRLELEYLKKYGFLPHKGHLIGTDYLKEYRLARRNLIGKNIDGFIRSRLEEDSHLVRAYALELVRERGLEKECAKELLEFAENEKEDHSRQKAKEMLQQLSKKDFEDKGKILRDLMEGNVSETSVTTLLHSIIDRDYLISIVCGRHPLRDDAKAVDNLLYGISSMYYPDFEKNVQPPFSLEELKIFEDAARGKPEHVRKGFRMAEHERIGYAMANVIGCAIKVVESNALAPLSGVIEKARELVEHPHPEIRKVAVGILVGPATKLSYMEEDGPLSRDIAGHISKEEIEELRYFAAQKRAILMNVVKNPLEDNDVRTEALVAFAKDLETLKELKKHFEETGDAGVLSAVEKWVRYAEYDISARQTS